MPLCPAQRRAVQRLLADIDAHEYRIRLMPMGARHIEDGFDLGAPPPSSNTRRRWGSRFAAEPNLWTSVTALASVRRCGFPPG